MIKLKNRQIGAAGFVANKIMENAISKFKQETLEEVAENYAEKWNDLENQFKLSSCFMAGAKWQQERMYSEEDMIRFASLYSNININKSHLEYFNNLPKFKKK
jgi:hypothetical protein